MADPRSISTGIGQGEAQIIQGGISPYWTKANEAKYINKDKKEKKSEELFKDLKTLNHLDINPRDLQRFIDHGKQIDKYVKDNWNDIDRGDTSKLYEVKKMISDIENEALLSKNHREVIESSSKNIDEYDDTSKQLLLDQMDPTKVDYNNLQSAYNTTFPALFKKREKPFDFVEAKSKFLPQHTAGQTTQPFRDAETGLLGSKMVQNYGDQKLGLKEFIETNPGSDNFFVDFYNKNIKTDPKVLSAYEEEAKKNGTTPQVEASIDLLYSKGLKRGTTLKQSSGFGEGVTYAKITPTGEKVLSLNDQRELNRAEEDRSLFIDEIVRKQEPDGGKYAMELRSKLIKDADAGVSDYPELNKFSKVIQGAKKLVSQKVDKGIAIKDMKEINLKDASGNDQLVKVEAIKDLLNGERIVEVSQKVSSRIGKKVGSDGIERDEEIPVYERRVFPFEGNEEVILQSKGIKEWLDKNPINTKGKTKDNKKKIPNF